MKKTKTNTTKVPFFARYLEVQELQTKVSGGYVTMKFPSDCDEGGIIVKK